MSTPVDFDSGLIDQLMTDGYSSPPLRVAVATTALQLPCYALPLLQAMRRSRWIDVCGVLDQPRVPHDAPSWQPLYRAYLRWIDSRAGLADPYALIDGSACFEGVPIIVPAPAATTNNNARPFDVILDFSQEPHKAALGAMAEYGLWRLCPGDGGSYAEAPQMQELMHDATTTTVELRQYGPEAALAQVRGRARFSMEPDLAVSRSRIAPAFGGAYLAVAELRRIRCLQATPAAIPPAAAAAAHPSVAPTNLELGGWLLRRACRGLGNRLRNPVLVRHWRIALRHSAVPLPATPDVAALEQFNWLESPRNHFWADPFLIEHAGSIWLFFEDLDHAQGRACLRAAPIAADGTLGESVPTLVRPQHLSYPHVFAADGEMFMVPESAEQGVIELLRCVQFPHRWRHEATLLNLKAVDSTLFRHAGRWWMFTSPMPIAGHAPVTLLYGAERLTGPWTLHPINPVCSDVRFARCAGAVLELDGRLLRPSQDCGGRYGRALVFNEIRALDTAAFDEFPFATLTEGTAIGLYGVHTYNRAGMWEAIDGRFLRRRDQV